MTQAIVKTENQVEASEILAVIAKAVSDPKIDVEKMERLLAMHERIRAEQQKVAFVAAMARLQEKLPQIAKDGEIIVKGQLRSKFVRTETLDAVIRPLLAEEGFSFSFDSNSQDGKLFVISARLSHREGHSETKSVVLPLDTSEYRSVVQCVGSTVSYGRRQLMKMHLNIIEANDDVDGLKGNEPITDDQVKDLETMIVDTNSNKPNFLRFLRVERLEDLNKNEYAKAINALEDKKRNRR